MAIANWGEEKKKKKSKDSTKTLKTTIRLPKDSYLNKLKEKQI